MFTDTIVRARGTLFHAVASLANAAFKSRPWTAPSFSERSWTPGFDHGGLRDEIERVLIEREGRRWQQF